MSVAAARMWPGVHAALWMKTWQDDVVPYLHTASDLGFESVELSLLGSGRELRRIRDEAEALGVELTCTTGLARGADPTSADAQERRRGILALEDSIERAASLGASLLSGVIYAPWGVLQSDRRDERFELAAEALSHAGDVAAEHGITLGIEAINRYETDLVNTSAQATALARAVGRENVGVLLDAYHMNIEERDVGEAIRTCGHHLVHLHVASNERGAPRVRTPWWDALFDGLDDIGYEGRATLELFVQAGEAVSSDLTVWRDIEPDPTAAARDGLAFLRGMTG